MILKAMTSNDLDSVVPLHQEAFEGFFLTRMGPQFLRSYYQTILDFEGNISLVACDPHSDRVMGFAVGFCDPQGFYSSFARRRRRMLPIIALAIARDLRLVPQILRNRRRVEAEAQKPIDAVELASIAVGTQGRGVGSRLLDAFTAQARLTGALRLTLTTDAIGNNPVRRFYEEHGFTLHGYEDRGGRTMCCYVKSLG